MNKIIFCHEVYYTVLAQDLHSNGEVVSSFWQKVDVDRLLHERRIWGRVINLYDMQLMTDRDQRAAEEIL